ncbi:MAG TPA: PDZ domain-containing protein, partial [Phenylobacterium sp.]|nr:PDZ domain-containing protein [Phenylobacterium sp.]
AQRAGLAQGDVILTVDGQAVSDVGGLNYAVGTRRVGETLRLRVRRQNGQEADVSLRAEAPPATPARDEQVLSGRHPFDGATVVNLSPAVADELGVDPFLGPGVLVTRVGRGVSLNAGMRPGDMVRAVNGTEIRTVRDLVRVLEAGAPAWQVTIQRNGQQITANFRL